MKKGSYQMKTYFEIVVTRILENIKKVNDESTSSEMNRIQYGCICAWSQYLRDNGHKVDFGVFRDMEKNDRLTITFFSINEDLLFDNTIAGDVNEI